MTDELADADADRDRLGAEVERLSVQLDNVRWHLGRVTAERDEAKQVLAEEITAIGEERIATRRVDVLEVIRERDALKAAESVWRDAQTGLFHEREAALCRAVAAENREDALKAAIADLDWLMAAGRIIELLPLGDGVIALTLTCDPSDVQMQGTLTEVLARARAIAERAAALAVPETSIGRTDLITAYAAHLRTAGERADAAEAAIERVRTQHRQDDPEDPMCRHCRMTWPCPTRRALAVPESNEDARPAKHIGGRANAEDCPACEGTNPPYPFICPGETTPDAPTETADE